MSSEIEKMYENVGIEPTHYDACVLEDKYWNNEELANQYGTFDGYLSFECPNCGEGCYSTCEYAYDQDVYPPFTAEKQLFLIQWLAETRPIHINLLLDKWTIEGMVRYGIKYDTFEDALSGYVNQIWQDLTETEREEIKKILKG